MRRRETGSTNIGNEKIPAQAGPPGSVAPRDQVSPPVAPADRGYGDESAATSTSGGSGDQAPGGVAGAGTPGRHGVAERRYEEPSALPYGRPAGASRIVRSKGALAGLLLVALGIWGAIVPFVGPYFSYGLGTSGPWQYTTGRLWLHILPGVAVPSCSGEPSWPQATTGLPAG